MVRCQLQPRGGRFSYGGSNIILPPPGGAISLKTTSAVNITEVLNNMLWDYRRLWQWLSLISYFILTAIAIVKLEDLSRLQACATVDLEKFCHGTPLTEINDAVDDGPSTTVYTAPWTVDCKVLYSLLSTLVLLYTIWHKLQTRPLITDGCRSV